MRRWVKLLAMAIGATALMAGAVGSALAHDDDQGWHRGRGHHRYFYEPPRRIIYVERPVVYVPPRPVFVEPQPYYYGPPSLNINIPLR